MGKSTLYQSLQSLQDMPRVNTDEILRDFGDWRNMADVMTAGKIAVKMIDQYFGDSITFNQETTLCGKSILKNIAKAKDIERRYIDTFINLKIVLPKCDLVAFYDNTIEFRRFAIYKNGKPVRVSHDVPVWYEKFIEM